MNATALLELLTAGAPGPIGLPAVILAVGVLVRWLLLGVAGVIAAVRGQAELTMDVAVGRSRRRDRSP